MGPCRGAWPRRWGSRCWSRRRCASASAPAMVPSAECLGDSLPLACSATAELRTKLGTPHISQRASCLEPPSWLRTRTRRSMMFQATQWTAEQTPYETLELQRSATDEEIKAAYRTMAKKYHPDVYDKDSEELPEGETSASRFIRVQAAYELLMHPEERLAYDTENRENPLKASRAWREWVEKKRKAFDHRGELGATVWAEQQQRELSLRARNLSKAKMDPEEERRLLAKERQASVESFETTIKRHGLVLKKRDMLRRKADDAKKQRLVQELLLQEGFVIDEDDT